MQGSTIALISTSCTVTSALLMAIGWKMIRLKRRNAHRNCMIASVLFAALFFTLYVYRTVAIGNTNFGGPAYLQPYYTGFLLFHVLLTVISPVLAITTMVYAWKENFEKHRKIGPWTARVWFVTAVTGLLVYLLLFVLFPEGETINHFQRLAG